MEALSVIKQDKARTEICAGFADTGFQSYSR